MSKQTPLLIPPTLDEIKREAAKMKLPVREAEKFFWYWETTNWYRGKVRIRSWVGALNTWRLNYEERKSNSRIEQEASDSNKALDRMLKNL